MVRIAPKPEKRYNWAIKIGPGNVITTNPDNPQAVARVLTERGRLYREIREALDDGSIHTGKSTAANAA